ncbi:MAG: helix-turn-helix transcriptional regulator [Candidatus Xenobiia bacterium LiM19]
MKSIDLKKAQIVLTMYLLITKNPHMTPKDVQKELGIGKDRYHRYFDELCNVVPFSYVRKEKRYTIGSEFNNRDAVKKQDEFYTFITMLQGISEGKGSSCEDALKILEKVKWYGPHMDYVRKYCVFLDDGDSSPTIPLNLFLLNLAIMERRRVKFAYAASTKQIPSMRIDPLRLIHDEYWYLLGRTVDKGYEGAQKYYRISRMSNVEQVNEKFDMPKDVDINIVRMSIPWDFFNSNTDKPEQVTVQFSGPAVRYITESHFHSTQRVEQMDDTSVNFHVEVRSPLNMVKWILSFGSNARVLEPLQLVEAVKKEVGKLYGIYHQNQ